VVSKHQRKVTQINVAVFGFSRGAAEARAFANWLGELLKQDSGRYTLAGIPLRVYFMGLFDTVASVGMANLFPGVNGHMAWADGNMHIAPVVEQCVHYIALHEQRACFPSETAAKVKQVVYPGMHSDVGGGYLPEEQGKRAQLSQIPLNDMYHEAMKAGVPLLTRAEINAEPKLKKDFFIPPDLIEAYKVYWRDSGITTGSATAGTKSLVHQHTHEYLQWRGGLLERWQDLSQRGFYKRANAKDRKELDAAQQSLVQQLSELRARLRIEAQQTIQAPLRTPSMANYPLYDQSVTQHEPVDPATRTLLAALDDHARLPETVRQFMDDYVHDSRAGFPEPYQLTGGYLRYRNIYQNTRQQVTVASAEGGAARDATSPTTTALAGTAPLGFIEGATLT
jgi:hypothetical protein